MLVNTVERQYIERHNRVVILAQFFQDPCLLSCYLIRITYPFGHCRCVVSIYINNPFIQHMGHLFTRATTTRRRSRSTQHSSRTRPCRLCSKSATAASRSANTPNIASYSGRMAASPSTASPHSSCAASTSTLSASASLSSRRRAAGVRCAARNTHACSCGRGA